MIMAPNKAKSYLSTATENRPTCASSRELSCFLLLVSPVQFACYESAKGKRAHNRTKHYEALIIRTGFRGPLFLPI